MSRALIEDYLNTQGMRLSIEAVQIAYLTLGTVYQMAKPDNLPENLWQSDDQHAFEAVKVLPQTPENDALLRSVYAVLDSVFERFPAKVAWYVLQPQSEVLQMHRYWHNACPLPASLQEGGSQDDLLHRVAQTGWAQVIDDAKRWVDLGQMTQAQSHVGLSQMWWPLTAPSGAVLGVLSVSSPEASAFDEQAQAWWLAAALTVADALYSVLPSENGKEDESDVSIG